MATDATLRKPSIGPVNLTPASAPAPAPSSRTSTTSTSTPTPTSMPYNCQACVRRKVKCDRAVPICSTCVKTKHDCVYQAPPKPRRKKRKAIEDSIGPEETDEDVHERLARYERILRQNGLLSEEDGGGGGATHSRMGKDEDQDDQAPAHSAISVGAAKEARCTNPIHQQIDHSAYPERQGRLVASGGKSRYIDSNLWLDNNAEELQDLSDDADGNPSSHPPGMSSHHTPAGFDPASGALLGFTQDLLEFHPPYTDALTLWAIHTRNVEPLCRILHIPTTTRMVESVSRRPSTATRGQECQLFAIYHFAIYSLQDEDCQREFNQPRAVLLSRYGHALRQALVNASWLRTTEMSVMQAYMLYLIAGRSFLDPHTFWILAGIGVRIAQRMGLHRDGAKLGLPPFEVQMRRRLFWQLIPMEGFAGQHSGTGISMPPSSWDVQKPLNVNDEDIYPGMTTMPEEKSGATDMIYCLARAELSHYYSRRAMKMKDGFGPSVTLKGGDMSMKIINEVEESIESKYLRYCDIINPLHYLVLVIVRSAANVVRLRIRITPLKNQTISDPDRRELCTLALRILDSDNAIYQNVNLKNYRWAIKEFFLWDALMCVLTSLAKPGFFSATTGDLDDAWRRVLTVWTHHPELLDSGRPSHVNMAKLTLEAWTANPPSNPYPEPAYITELMRRRSSKSVRTGAVPMAVDRNLSSSNTSLGGETAAYRGDSNLEGLSPLDGTFGGWDESGPNFDSGISPTGGDWVFWDQFFQNTVGEQG